MSEVKRVEAKGVLRELKDFAFDGNYDFQHGVVAGVEMQKSFVFPTSPVHHEDGSYDIPYQKTIVGFRAARLEKVRNHSQYDYTIHATSERSIPQVPAHILDRLFSVDESDSLAEIDHFDIEDGELSESTTVTFTASDAHLGQIYVTQSYEIAVDDQQLFEHSDNDIFYDTPGEFVNIPLLESTQGVTKRFVEEPIVHEQLPIDEKILSEIAFRAILNPFFYSEYSAVIDFRDATKRIQAILQVMHDGINVRQLYEEVK